MSDRSLKRRHKHLSWYMYSYVHCTLVSEKNMEIEEIGFCEITYCLSDYKTLC